VPGRYEKRYERRWVPGHWEEDRESRRGGWAGDEEDREDEGRRIWVPGQYRETPVRVWIDGHWEERG